MSAEVLAEIADKGSGRILKQIPQYISKWIPKRFFGENPTETKKKTWGILQGTSEQIFEKENEFLETFF